MVELHELISKLEMDSDVIYTLLVISDIIRHEPAVVHKKHPDYKRIPLEVRECYNLFRQELSGLATSDLVHFAFKEFEPALKATQPTGYQLN